MDACPVTDLTQEARFAVAMTGGVSLAVWMGGVAREVNLLQQASDSRPREDGVTTPWARPKAQSRWDVEVRGLYRRLLELLDVTVTVDVLSGTSAGGINAALLGMSNAGGADLAGLRDLWLTAGSMEDLLRDPGEKNPPSLMQGDQVLYARLLDGIRKIHNGRMSCGPIPECRRSTTVYITTTMMSGEVGTFSDDYGTLVSDVNHHGLFTFDQDALAPDVEASRAQSLTALALAARSSASFPGAFEPSFIPIGESSSAAPGKPERPDMSSYANMTRSHFVADGGLLANRPISPLLSAVFARPADREIRRILAYVVPDSGGAVTQVRSPEQASDALSLAQALHKDLDAQLSQSIAGDLRTIRTHEEQVQSGHDLRCTLAELGARLAPRRLVTPRILDDYRDRQSHALAMPLVDALMNELATMKSPSRTPAFPELWERALGPGGTADQLPLEQRLLKSVTSCFVRDWTYPPSGAEVEHEAAHLFERVIQYGPAVLHEEFLASFSPAGIPAPVAGQDIFAQAARFGRPALIAAQAVLVQLVRLGYRLAVTADQRNALAAHRRAVSSVVKNLPSRDAAREARELLRKSAGASPVPGLEEVAAQFARSRWEHLTADEPGPGGEVRSLADCWQRLEQAAIPLLTTLHDLAGQDTSERRARSGMSHDIATYWSYLHSVSDSAGTVASRLLDLVIAERALEPITSGSDQPVEFIQVSANTRTLLSAGQDTAQKLRGLDLHHFAAFCKSSWRAYDWMWGRLDGAGWLVHILLDPRRILAVCENRPDLYGARHERPAKFLDALLEAVGLQEVSSASKARLLNSLEFLAVPTEDVPIGLPDFALEIAQAWQEMIVANELPEVAKQMLADSRTRPQDKQRQSNGKRATSAPAGPPDEWALRVQEMGAKQEPARNFADMLPSCPVGTESVSSELHTSPFLQMGSKAIAVAAAAIAAAPELPKQIKPVLASTRTITQTGYRAIKSTGGKPGVMLTLGIAAAIVGAVLATQGMMIIGVGGTIIALVGLYVAVMAAWEFELSRGLVRAVAGVTVLAALGCLTLAWVRAFLWAQPNKETKAKAGLLSAHVLPWLQSTWWGGLAVLGALLILTIVIGSALRTRPTQAASSGYSSWRRSHLGAWSSSLRPSGTRSRKP